MISRNSFYLLIIIAAMQFGCSDAAKQPREITFDDRLKVVKNQQTGEYEAVSYKNENGKDQKDSIKTLTDNSTLNTMFDGTGNKTETRFFDNNPLIKCLILRTSVRGERQIQVYAQNGDIKFLPDNVIDKALSASANDLAAAAGIYEQRKTNGEVLSESENQKSEIEFIQPSINYDFLPKAAETPVKKVEPDETTTENEKNTASTPPDSLIANDMSGQAEN